MEIDLKLNECIATCLVSWTNYFASIFSLSNDCSCRDLLFSQIRLYYSKEWLQSKMLKSGSTHLEVCFLLRCFQQFSSPYIATQRVPRNLSTSASKLRELVHQWYVLFGPLVQEKVLLNTPTPSLDRDQTVSRRSEPSSRTTLMGEQPNPFHILLQKDVMSRHRGAKPPRRCELLGEISLLSLE